MVIISKNKYTGSSAQKVRLVADTIRGKSAVESSEILPFLNKVAAKHVKKCLDTAIANAVDAGMNKNDLVISKILIDEGPTRKWRRSASRGRIREIMRRTSHIIVELKEK